MTDRYDDDEESSTTLTKRQTSDTFFLANLFAASCARIGVKVLTQNIDTGTPEGRLFFHMTAAFDEF